MTIGQAYTKADFISFYGGTAEWDRSPVFQAPVGSKKRESGKKADKKAAPSKAGALRKSWWLGINDG